jgi:C-terminal processing protease CtpA/Prc
MGDRTAGSSANPRLLELPGKITVRMPQWIDYDAQGKSIEDVGIAPAVRIDAKPEEFTNTSDPVLQAALDLLRKTPPAGRKSAGAQ